jgi:hypothetical protein
MATPSASTSAATPAARATVATVNADVQNLRDEINRLREQQQAPPPPSEELQNLRDELARLRDGGLPDAVNAELQTLRDEIARLRQQPPDPDEELRAELARFQARERSLFAPKQAKFPVPPEYSGRPSEYLPFIVSCEMYFDVMKDTYTTDDLKVAFAIGRLRGRPSTWAYSLVRNKDPVLDSWLSFKAEMDAMFTNVHELEDLRQRLESLKQTGSALNYATEFKTLASTLQLNAPAKILMFKAGLKDKVKEGLSYASDTNTFDALVSRAIAIDQNQFSQRKNSSRSNSNSGAKPQQQQHSSNPPPSSSRSQLPRNVSLSSSSHRSELRPFVPYGRVSDEEKARRKRENLCGYCGGKHAFEDCPELAAKNAKKAKENGKQQPPKLSSHAVVLSHDNNPFREYSGKHDA